MKNLHPGARWLYRIRAYPVLVVLMIYSSILAGIYGFVIGLLLIIFGGEGFARMSYNRFLYEINNHEVRIEQGIIWKKYTSIPYQRIQNVEIRRGIIARIFGFSTVEIETAGQSGFGQSGFRFGRSRQYMSEGHLPAIDIQGAEQIRSFVMKKIKKTHKSGL